MGHIVLPGCLSYCGHCYCCYYFSPFPTPSDGCCACCTTPGTWSIQYRSKETDELIPASLSPIRTQYPTLHPSMKVVSQEYGEMTLIAVADPHAKNLYVQCCSSAATMAHRRTRCCGLALALAR